MKIAFIYLGIAAIGYLIAAFLHKKKNSFSWIGRFLPIVVTLLIFTMGFRIGENREVVSNIGTIGIMSLVMAVVSLAICIPATSAVRRLLGYDRYGMRRGEDASPERARSERKGKTKLLTPSTIRYLCAVVLGFLLGYILVIKASVFSFETASSVSGTFVTYALYVMVFLVGMDMGFDGSLPQVFRSTGIRAIAFPLTVAFATMIAMAVMSVFVELNVKEMICVGCTFGWYSLGPNIIMDAGMITAGAYAFLVNFLRDMISILIIPWVADRFGYVETIGLPQAAAMDVCIATIEGATNKATTALAFFSGAVFTIIIPVFLPIIAG